MTRFKISSDPYKSLITYQKWDSLDETWRNFAYSDNKKSSLFKGKLSLAYFPFKAKEILDIIYSEFCVKGETLEVVFEGTDDEYDDLKSLCDEEPYSSTVMLFRSENVLNNASDILPQIVDIFKEVTAIVTETNCKKKVQEESKKFAEATTQEIPVFVIGTYSSGKSTFINALIGAEILPSNSNPVTAKIFRIAKSNSPDTAVISFRINDLPASISITKCSFQVDCSQGCTPIQGVIKNILEQQKDYSLNKRVNVVLEALNVFIDESNNYKLSDDIYVEVPFGHGVLADSNHSYIIIDTPGPNSATYEEHGKLLQKAMKGYSNGILVFVSVLDGLDTTDSLRIYKAIEKEREFDRRFALIIVNKADEGELPEKGNDEVERKIRNQKLPKELYAEGIFFVSSIMALGAKVGGTLNNRFYKEKYDEKSNKYLNPKSEHYKQLYKYNIMPKQLKTKAEEMSEAFGDNIYANSGMYWVEKEIETFAEKYSPYNKCKQATVFLDNVIEATKEELKKETKKRERKLNNLKDGYDKKRRSLLERVETRSAELKVEETALYDRNMNAVIEKAKSYCSVDELYEKQEKFRKDNYRENEVWNKKKAKQAARQSLFKEPLKIGKNIKNLSYSSKQYGKAKKDSDYQTGQDLLGAVEKKLKRNLTKGQKLLDKESKKYWKLAANTIRSDLARIIAESKALEDSQRRELAETIIRFRDIPLDTNVKVFRNGELLKRGLKPFRHLLNGDALDLKKVKRAYESEMKDKINSTDAKIRTEHKNSFNAWLGELDELIKNNIESYSPTLTAQRAVIGKEEKKIAELEARYKKLCEYAKQVKDMISPVAP